MMAGVGGMSMAELIGCVGVTGNDLGIICPRSEYMGPG